MKVIFLGFLGWESPVYGSSRFVDTLLRSETSISSCRVRFTAIVGVLALFDVGCELFDSGGFFWAGKVMTGWVREEGVSKGGI